jgi:sortase (surface protein transpeptidase)
MYLHSRQDELKKPSSLPAATANAPSSVRPSRQAVATHAVLLSDPKYISIPSIDTGDIRVFKLGLLNDKSIAAPNNIFDAGWYKESAKPGEQGAMFIYGHLSSWEARGAFYNLKKLIPGQKINVVRGDNMSYTYEVVSTKVYAYDKVDMNRVLAPIDPAKPGLNLMTCSGSLIEGTNDFSERLAVFTRQVEN